MAYLSLCSIYRDQADYLQEWIEFHRLVGVERFFLYDNSSQDAHLEVLAPYLGDGTVTVHHWPNPAEVRAERVPWGLVEAFEDCLVKHRDDSRWIAFIDVDEFLFSPTQRKVSEILVEYEEWPGVCVSQVEFGTSGHRVRPPGLVIENYEHRMNYPPGSLGPVKSIVDPTRAIECWNSHKFLYREGLAVDEDKQPVDPPPADQQHPVSFSRLRLNHYRFKSEEEALRKKALWESAGRRLAFTLRWVEETMTELDREIMGYVPLLRQVISTAEERSSRSLPADG